MSDFVEKLLEKMLPKLLENINQAILNMTIEVEVGDTGDGGKVISLILHPKDKPAEPA
jgi:hypothetical protein